MTKGRQNYSGLEKGSRVHNLPPIPDSFRLKYYEWAARHLLAKPSHGLTSIFGRALTKPPVWTENEAALAEAMKPREHYNTHGEEVVLLNEILTMNVECACWLEFHEQNIGPEIIRIGPNDWANLPHGFYIGYLKSGSPYKPIVNFGSKKELGINKVIALT